MNYDSGTITPLMHTERYNLQEDKHKFVPVKSREEFIKQYREFRERTDGTEEHQLPYNEILVNLFPEAIVGLVSPDSSHKNMLKMLTARNFLFNERDIDLPITFMNNGKLHEIEPTKDQIAEIINLEAKKMLDRKFKSHPVSESEKNKIYGEFVKSLGYEIEKPDFSKELKGFHLKPLIRNEYRANDIVKAVSKLSGIGEGGLFSYGIKGRLEEVVNARLKVEGKAGIDDINSALIKPKDIEHLVDLLDEEVQHHDKKHALSKSDKTELITAIKESSNILKNGGEMALARSEKLGDLNQSSIKKKFKDFFLSLKSYFKDHALMNKLGKEQGRKSFLERFQAKHRDVTERGM